MTDNVVKLQLVEVGEAYEFKADELLEAWKGCGLKDLLILGECEDGELVIAGTYNRGEAVLLIEMAKQKLVFGDL
jgi:hypothetical protein